MIKDQPAFWQKCIIALVAAQITFAKQVAFFLVVMNRYYLHWEFADNLALIFGVLALAGIGLGISVALKSLRWDRTRRVYNHLFVLLLVNGLLTLVPAQFSPQFSRARLVFLVWSVLWLLIAGVIVFAIYRPRFQLVRYSGNLCLVLSPLVPILFYQTLTMKPWSLPKESHADLQPAIPTSTTAAAGKTPVFIFVFDEWSYPRTVRSNEFLPELTQLRGLAGQSCFFINAWSFAPVTMQSLPAMLFQAERHTKVGRRNVSLLADGKSIPASGTSNIFSLAKASGYVTALEGFYHPYGRLVGRHLDYCRAFSVYPTRSSLWRKVAASIIQNHFWFTDPFTAKARRRFEATQQGNNFYELNNLIRDEALRLIKECPANSLVFVHLPLPHGPFVFNADGSFNGPLAGNPVIWRKPTEDDYHRHLLYMDRVAGQFIAALKAAGKFDNALLIFTSDHGWREDPADKTGKPFSNPLTRKVPLVIKFPGQQQAMSVGKTIYNHLHLRPILERALREKLDARSALELITGLEDVPPPTSRRASPTDEMFNRDDAGPIPNE